MSVVADQAHVYRLLIAKVRTAVDQIEALMLSDAWDAVPPERQRALAEVSQQLRVDLAPLQNALGEPFLDEN